MSCWISFLTRLTFLCRRPVAMAEQPRRQAVREERAEELRHCRARLDGQDARLTAAEQRTLNHDTTIQYQQGPLRWVLRHFEGFVGFNVCAKPSALCPMASCLPRRHHWPNLLQSGTTIARQMLVAHWMSWKLVWLWPMAGS